MTVCAAQRLSTAHDVPCGPVDELSLEFVGGSENESTAEVGTDVNPLLSSVEGRSLVFVDESSKDDRTIYRHYGRAPAGSRATIPAQFVRGERFSIVAALTTDGYMDTSVVEVSVDGSEFFDFIIEKLVRSSPSFDPF